MAETKSAIDISNLQGHPDTWPSQPWYPQYQAADLVMVQCLEPPAGFPGHDFIDPETGKRGYTGVALRQARADGKLLGIYSWLWDAFSGETLIADQNNRLECVPASVQLDVRPFLDVEDTSADDVADRRDDVLVALGALDGYAHAHGLPDAGVYTGQWYIDGPSYLGGWFPEGRVEWIADYSKAAGSMLNDTGRVGHQFTSTPTDMDVFLASEIVSHDSVSDGASQTSQPETSVRETPEDWQWPTWREAAINLKSIADTMGQQLTAAQAQASSLQTALDNANASNTALQGRVNALVGERDAALARSSKLNDQVDQLQAQIAAAAANPSSAADTAIASAAREFIHLVEKAA